MKEILNPSPSECHRYKSKYGALTHYCLADPGKDCPPLDRFCTFSQFKPVYHRMLRRQAEQSRKNVGGER